MFPRCLFFSSAVLFLACAEPPVAQNLIPVARTLTGEAPAQVLRVEALGSSGKTTVATLQGGRFSVAVPAEPWVLLFKGANQRLIANLTAPGGSGRSALGVFPAPRIASTTSRLEGPVTRQQQPLLSGEVLSIGVVTITLTVATGQYNLLQELDSDGDGRVDFEDEDDDGDATPDVQEPRTSLDSDGDGLCNAVDPDDDNDELTDEADLDDDGDGIADTQERDTDGDGIADSVDLDDDGDGTGDGEELADPTPDVLVGAWLGETTVTDFEFSQGRPVVLAEHFQLTDDGQMIGDFDGVDAVSGCHVNYALRGTWADAVDATPDLEVVWSSVISTVTQCNDPQFDGTGEVDAAEREIWDDELDGLWWVSSNTLVIDLGDGVHIEYDRAL